MTDEKRDDAARGSRLLTCFLRSAEDLDNDAVMLCEVVGDEIQSVSLRVAADPMTRWLMA